MSKMENKFNRKQQIKYTTKPFNVSKLVEALILVDTFNILQSTTRRPELWEKYDKKNKKVQDGQKEHTYYPLWVKR